MNGSPNRVPEAVTEERRLGCDAATAFELFTRRLATWWPADYTWSQDELRDLWIEPVVAGTCRERDARGIESPWGVVIACHPQRHLAIRWMIDPDRSFQPDPALASRVAVTWTVTGDHCRAELTHDEFERHPGDATAYREGLASPQGWPLLMDRYAEACREAAARS